VVFEDVDGNGVQDIFGGEMGLAGWSVQLYNSLGQVIATSTTLDDGSYEFAGLSDGSYAVCVVAAAGYSQTAPAQDASHPCGGWGMSFNLQGTFETWAVNNFGYRLNP